MEFTALVFGHHASFQSEQFQGEIYWRIIWSEDDTRDILQKQSGQWISHTASPSLIKELGSIIDNYLEKGR